MSLYRIVAFLVLGCLLASPANATLANISRSGNEFLETCSVIDKPTEKLSEQDWFDTGRCFGFVEGVNAGISMSFAILQKGAGSMEDVGACIPLENTVTHVQMIRVVLKYIKENPERAHEATVALIIEALKKAFPCTAKVPHN